MVTSGVPGDTEVLRLLRQVTATPPEPHRARPRSSRHQWSLRPLSRRALNDCLDMFASPPATFLPSQRTGRRHDSRGTARRTPAGLPEREGAAYIAPGTSDKRGLADEFRCHGWLSYQVSAPRASDLLPAAPALVKCRCWKRRGKSAAVGRADCADRFTRRHL
jgi:hypothetical protein